MKAPVLQPPGAFPSGDGGCRFLVYAPRAEKVAVRILASPERIVPLDRRDRGYHDGVVDGVAPGTRYLYRLDGDTERPDPASRFQPEGVHGPSEVVDLSRVPRDDGGYAGVSLGSYVLYEIHVGAFTPEGTFDAVIPRLDALVDLGVTAVEIMPVAQFPGRRNWGYDGVYPYAVQESYGGPLGLLRLVDACHRRGLAVVLDVVYNHLGPEGNYLADFGPYFSDRYRTPWGPAVNFDGPDSDEVRRYFLGNALYWLEEFRIDALRIDAVHGIMDFSAFPFLAELAAAVCGLRRRERRRVYLIAESDLNDTRIVAPPERGGFGLDAQWNDDLHHALHTLLTKERAGYYADFGSLRQLAKTFSEGFVYSGQYSRYRRRRHGNSSRGFRAGQFVVFSQNHDQVGNRMLGERLASLVPFEALKLAAGVVLLSPFLPLLFMGEEYGETAPFLYFVHHGDPALVEAVRKGREEEFSAFGWQGRPADPQDEETFLRSKVRPALGESGSHALLRELYRELIRLRKEDPVLGRPDNEDLEATVLEGGRALFVLRWHGRARTAVVYHFGEESSSLAVPLPPGRWKKLLCSSDARWGGAGGKEEDLDSQGDVRLEVGPLSFLLLAQTIEESS